MLRSASTSSRFPAARPRLVDLTGAACVCRLLMVGLTALIGSLGFLSGAGADDAQLTFFGWSDQHVQTDGDGSHLLPAIDAMNRLPGTSYPESIGGKVDTPAFVFGCGDITEWPTHAAKETFDRLLRERLRFKAYNVLGNHDEGGKAPSETMKKWAVDQHGALSYTFTAQGIRFICLFSRYDESLNNPAQPLTREALDFLRRQLQQAAPTTPTIVATHLCYDALTNRDALVDAIGKYNVLAILGGHYHKAKVDHYRGQHFVQLPSPAPGSPSEVTVFRVSRDRLIAIPFDYTKQEWSTEPHKVLDVRLVPAATGADSGH